MIITKNNYNDRTLALDSNATKKMANNLTLDIIGVLLFITISVLISIVLYFTLSWMLDDKRIPLSEIVLDGDLVHIQASDVQRVFSTIENIGTFMSQDIKVLQNAVETLPWVAYAAIRKQWPNKIKIFITEHRVAATWNCNKLLNDKSEIFFGNVASLKNEVVKLYGHKNSEKEVFETYNKLQPEFASIGLSISSLVLNERRAWQIILDNGIRLEMGTQSLYERIQRFFDLYATLESNVQDISYIDLRYDTGAAVGWVPERF